jgi:hypothetical protein
MVSQLRVAGNGSQDVVKIVRDSSRQDTDCLQFLRVPEVDFHPGAFFFRTFPLGDFFLQERDCLVQFSGAFLDVMFELLIKRVDEVLLDFEVA